MPFPFARLSFALSLVTTLGCASGCSHNGPLFTPTEYTREPIHASQLTLVLVDDRHDVIASRRFATPLVSTPGGGVHASIALAPDAGARLEDVLRRIPRSGRVPLVFRVHVVEATAGWKATWTSEIEYASVKLDVEVLDAADGSAVARGFGEAWGESGSADATDDGPAALFDRALIVAFERAVATTSAAHTINAAVDARHTL